MRGAQRAAEGLVAHWPLALFTWLAGVGAGLILTPLAALAAAGPISATRPLIWPGVLLLAAGLAVSLAHLGHPFRAPRAAVNLGRSRLSAEIVLALATAAGGAAALALPSWPLAAAAAGLLAAAFLVSLGLVYALPGQHAWRGPAAASPLSAALPLAALAFAALDGSGDTWRAVAPALLGAALALFAGRVRRLASMPPGHGPAHPALFRHRGLLLGLRFALVTLVPLLLTLSGWLLAAAAALAVGILADRVGFYALAVRHTMETGIADAEDALAS